MSDADAPRARPAYAPSRELRVRPLSPEEYVLWQANRGVALGLPAQPGTTEVGVLVYARTGPVANALVRAEPGVQLGAEIRALDLLDAQPAEESTSADVLDAVVTNFERGGYSRFTLWSREESAVAAFAPVGFAAISREFTVDLGAAPRRAKGRSRFARRTPATYEVAEAGDQDVASLVAWLTSARTMKALPRTPERAGLRTLLARDDQHALVLTEGDRTVGDAWVTTVEVPRADGTTVQGAVLNALRLRTGADSLDDTLEGVDAALRGWCQARGVDQLDVQVPATASDDLAEHARRLGYRPTGTLLELVLPEPAPEPA